MWETTLRVTCAGMADGGKIPLAYTGRGENRSPKVIIQNLSPDARTLAITLEDMSHPIKDFTHWVIWNLPAANRIDGGIPPGRTVLGTAKQGVAYGWHRYAGPKPPHGKSHRYRLTVYALDCAIDCGAHATKAQFLRRAKPHILQAGSVTGEFE